MRDIALTSVLDEDGGRPVSFFLALRLRHLELGTDFDVLVKLWPDMAEALFVRLGTSIQASE